MNFDRDPSNADEYFVTAVQIFDGCGVESSGSLRVDALMDKFVPFVKTNKAEFSCLKSLLDPEQNNPDINVTKLANALHKYSENQKTNLDESFNLMSGQAPQDSDSGISTDGLQILEELQRELKEKEHLAHQLRGQLDFTDRQHEETLASLTAERDSLMKHLNIVREENATLTHVRRDYDETCERLCASETALAAAKRELDALRKRAKMYEDHVTALENDKLTLQELLSTSKNECHRINEMYAARQSALLEENETIKTEHADLTSRFQDQEEFMQQVIKDKVLLEMELKDLLNKSNQTHLHLNRSIDVSYTDDQMLSALDSLNADSRFSQENRLLDEESFTNVLKEDQGRCTNISLFDEIRLSLCNMSRHNISECNNETHGNDDSTSDNSTITVGTQTDEDTNEIKPNTDDDKTEISDSDDIRVRVKSDTVEIIVKSVVDIGTQTEIEYKCNADGVNNNALKDSLSDKCEIYKDAEIQTDDCENLSVDKIQNNSKNKTSISTQTLGSYLKKRPFLNQHRVPCPKPKIIRISVQTQTTDSAISNLNNNAHNSKCLECEYTAKIEMDVKHSNLVVAEVQAEIAKYEDNLLYLQRLIDEGKDKNNKLLSVVEKLNVKVDVLQAVCETQGDVINNILEPDMHSVDCQTECDQCSVSTQVEVPCVECEKRSAIVPHRSLRRFFWEPLKALFQVFAVLCFVAALFALCGVARRAAPCRPSGFWRAQDFLDMLLRIEYTAEVPM